MRTCVWISAVVVRRCSNSTAQFGQRRMEIIKIISGWKSQRNTDYGCKIIHFPSSKQVVFCTKTTAYQTTTHIRGWKFICDLPESLQGFPLRDKGWSKTHFSIKMPGYCPCTHALSYNNSCLHPATSIKWRNCNKEISTVLYFWVEALTLISGINVWFTWY